MKVYVKTPARLHLGLIDLNGDLGRLFGGLGVGINRPNVVLEAERSETLAVTGEKTEQVKTLAKRFLETYNIKGNASINVKQVIPEHAGLGSGTQLALAVATSLAKLFNVKASVPELAGTMGRGQRTSVGTTIFAQGGFVVDGGKNTSKNSFPTTIFRQPFPQDWGFVVAVPNVNKGLAKNEETAAFKALAPMKTEDAGKMCRLTMMKLLPALVERDIKSFGEALTQIQIVIGDHFAEVQGGTYSSPAATEGIALLQKLGAYGAGQSSWGPAFYGLTQKEEAKEIELKVKTFLRKSVGGQVFVAKANNRGAYIKVTK
ncbi:kinase [Candidatus Bathyarchaeota archaeon]|nr:kinase [Candidatus Bathyarchaeota archaeon]